MKECKIQLQEKQSIINVGILAHVDAGKTTITEHMLMETKMIRFAGSVDEGTAKTDQLEVERRRGISVKSASVSMDYKNVRLQLIDTPGHVDFAGEVERALTVLDGAVLILSAVEGIQSHTNILFKALHRLKIPMLILINKIDRVGSNTKKIMQQLKEEFSAATIAMEEVLQEGEESFQIIEHISVLGECKKEFKDELYIALASVDEEFEECYLNEEQITDVKLIDGLQKSVVEHLLYPVYYSSAKYHAGIKEFLDGLITFLPPAKNEKELSGIVYKVEHDPVMGKAAHVRLFGGSLLNRFPVLVYGKEQTAEKISQIRKFQGDKLIDAGEVKAGEIGVLYGLNTIKAGDIIGKWSKKQNYPLVVPMLLIRVAPKKTEERIRLLEALQELSEEDPLLDFIYHAQTKEMNIKITGIIQLEILSELLQGRYGICADFSEPAVIYKEKPVKKAFGFEAYTMPKPCWAVVELTIEPLAKGSGLTFASVVKEELPYRYQNHVRTSVMETLKQGIYGWEVTDALVTLINGENHNMHTHPMDFFVATPIAVLRALTNAGSILLEPFIKVSLTAKEEFIGRVIGDILDMRGEFDSPVIHNGEFQMEAILPVASSLNYPITFQSFTSGKGIYSSNFLEYRECTPEFGAKLERRGVDPLDRAKWILACRSALV